jgi:O-methyltransferase
VVLRQLHQIDKQLDDLHKELATKDGKERPVLDDGFLPLAQKVKNQRRTMLTRERLWIIWQGVRNVAHLEGAAAEVGSFRGGSAYFIAAAFATNLGHEVPIEVIDTFEGHPETKLSDEDAPRHREGGTFVDTSYESVADFLSEFEQLRIHNGEFSDVAARLPDQRYRLVHVDVDLYESAIDCLRYFAPRTVEGGIIVLDDYGSRSCPGILKAAREFLTSEAGFQSWNPLTKQLVLVRRTTA